LKGIGKNTEYLGLHSRRNYSRRNNALPRKITGTDLKAEGNEVAIESIEIAHEGLTIENT